MFWKKKEEEHDIPTRVHAHHHTEIHTKSAVVPLIKNAIRVGLVVALVVVLFNYYQSHYVHDLNQEAITHYDAGRYHEAIAKWEELVKTTRHGKDVIYTNMGDAHKNIANAHNLDRGEFRKAADCYQKAANINGQSHAAYERLSTVLRTLGDNRGAYDAILKALEIQPENRKYQQLATKMKERL